MKKYLVIFKWIFLALLKFGLLISQKKYSLNLKNKKKKKKLSKPMSLRGVSFYWKDIFVLINE